MKFSGFKLAVICCVAVLAACSSVPLDDEPDQNIQQADFVTDKPLLVPPLSSLPEPPKRQLKGHYTKVAWANLPGWAQDDLNNVSLALINNCRGLMRPAPVSKTAPTFANPRKWHAFCQNLQASGLNQNSDGSSLRAFLQANLSPWRLDANAGKPAQNTVTGYYEPIIHASRKRHGNYQWPLYAVPHDLLTIDLGDVYPELTGKRVRGKLAGDKVVPYDTRAQIAANTARQPAAIVWANDPVEAFFLQIQGSGQATLDNGETIRLAYANHNGRPYVSIGKWLANNGEMPLAQTSMQNIKRWAQNNPNRVQELLNVNPAVVFFREEAVSNKVFGPRGAYGVPLLARRSIAVDTDYVPLGTPVFLATQMPGANTPLRQLVFAQDTGAAIKGAARADFYWGTGEQAGAQAGRMKQTGQMWLLLPN